MAVTIPVTVEQVASGLDTGMAKCCLHCDPTVIYELDNAAAKLFRFRPQRAAVTLTTEFGDGMPHLHVHRDDRSLKLTIKAGAPTWNQGKATLFFDAIGALKPAVGGLDPDVTNPGVPH